MDVIISGAIANFGGLTNQEFLKYLVEKAPEFEFYQLKPRLGTMSAAALDWRAVGNISSVLGIISFAWMAYIELIKPKKDSDSNGGIVIKIENGGYQNQFWIGNQINSKESLIEEVEKILKASNIDSTQVKKQIEIFKNSDYWQRVN